MDINQNVFYDEFSNKLKSLEIALNDLKDGNDYQENVNAVFRSLHTIKSTADLLYMFDVVRLTHRAEDLLEYIRSDKLKIVGKLCSLFIEFKNYIELCVDNTANGIFDDREADKLSIYFEKEFTRYIQKALNQETEENRIKTILVVDDSSLVRYMIKKVGKDEGYNVVISNNGIDGYEKLKNNEIDLLFCDLSTSDIGVKDMIKKIKQNWEYEFLSIVMLLDKNNKDILQLGKDIGAKAWLAKPIDQNKLSIILKKLLA